MISGYFLYNPDRQVVSKKMPKKILKILLYAVICFIVYGIFTFIAEIVRGASVFEALASVFPLNANSIIFFLVFNEPPVGDIAWYLWATIYCYLVLWFINRFNLYKISYYFIPILFVANIIVMLTQNVVFPIGQMGYHYEYVRNWLFVGLPFMLSGHFIATHKDKLIRFASQNVFWPILIASIIFCILEQYIYTSILLIDNINTCVFAFPYTWIIFIFSINNPSRYIWKPMAWVGLKLSLIVYLSHCLYRDILNLITEQLAPLVNDSLIYLWLKPFIIVAITLIISFVIEEIIRLIKVKKYTRKID